MTDIPFNPFKPSLYTPAELYDKFDPSDPLNSYRQSLDWCIYNSFIDPKTKRVRRVDIDVILMRRIHDASISEALDDLLDLDTSVRTVAIMGGHDVGRNKKVYTDIARLAQYLCREGYLVITGGGPGLMEAANLGAYTEGFTDPETALQQALLSLSDAPKYNDPKWLQVGYKTWKEMGEPDHPSKSRNVGIPTWFYGHEPPNIFATDIAKYFENSIREEGLLAVALGGVVFAEGNAGTVQEMFQDACQNYYRTYDQKKSPMILLGNEYWDPSGRLRHIPQDKRKSAYPLLEKLATEKCFADYLLVTDDVQEIVPFIKSHPPV